MDGILCPLTELMIFALRLWSFAILARILLSWVDRSPYPDNRFKEILFQITDPILEPLRRNIPPVGMFDISPIFAFVILGVISDLLASFMSDMGCVLLLGL